MTVPFSGTLADRLCAGRALGGWCNFASFGSVELMAQLGYDFLVLDMQHAEIAQAHLPALFGAFPAGGPLPVVRAAKNDYHLINWLFDQGAAGVIVPMTNSVEEARAAVRAAKYPPLGKRSFGPFRAARYGVRLAEYVGSADQRATLIVQVEDATAARNIDDILAVKGIDAVMVGPNDLAYSMLQPGESLNGDFSRWTAFACTPSVLQLCTHVMERCKAAGIPFGMTAPSVADAHEWLDRGASFATFGSDFLFLRTGAQSLGIPSGASK